MIIYTNSWALNWKLVIKIVMLQPFIDSQVNLKTTLKPFLIILKWSWKFGNMKTPSQKIATRMNLTGQFPPGKLPPKKIPTQDKSHLDSSHPRKFPPGQLPPRETPTRIIPTQENSHPDNFHPENYHPKISHPDNSHPRKIFIQPIATADNFHPANLIKFNNI